MSGEKTEQPTPKRLDDARKKGQVAQSKEMSSVIVLGGVFVLSVALAGRAIRSVGSYFDLVTTQCLQFEPGRALPILLPGLASTVGMVIGPVIGTVIILAIAAHAAQVGVLITGHPLKPDLNKFNPAQNVKRVFSKENLVNFLLAIVKVSLFVIVFGFVITLSLDALSKTMYWGMAVIPDVINDVFRKLFSYSLMLLLLIAGLDMLYRKHAHMQKLKMSKKEVMDEYKDMEGDPMIKGMRNQMRKEMDAEALKQRAATARVVVTDGVNIAIAVKYDEGSDPLPVVVAKGADQDAQIIASAAQEAGVPVQMEKDLAEQLMEEGQVDAYVPSPCAPRLGALMSASRGLL